MGSRLFHAVSVVVGDRGGCTGFRRRCRPGGQARILSSGTWLLHRKSSPGNIASNHRRTVLNHRREAEEAGACAMLVADLFCGIECRMPDDCRHTGFRTGCRHCRHPVATDRNPRNNDGPRRNHASGGNTVFHRRHPPAPRAGGAGSCTATGSEFFPERSSPSQFSKCAPS